MEFAISQAAEDLNVSRMLKILRLVIKEVQMYVCCCVILSGQSGSQPTEILFLTNP